MVKFSPKKKCFYYVSYKKIEELVKREYKKAYNIGNYSFIVDIEGINDTIYEFLDIGRDNFYNPNNNYCASKLKAFIEEGEYCYTIIYLLNDLAYKGKIPKGNYIISVYW